MHELSKHFSQLNLFLKQCKCHFGQGNVLTTSLHDPFLDTSCSRAAQCKTY